MSPINDAPFEIVCFLFMASGCNVCKVQQPISLQCQYLPLHLTEPATPTTTGQKIKSDLGINGLCAWCAGTLSSMHLLFSSGLEHLKTLLSVQSENQVRPWDKWLTCLVRRHIIQHAFAFLKWSGTSVSAAKIPMNTVNIY